MNQLENRKYNSKMVKSLCSWRTSKKRLCLGIECNGKKYFNSLGNWNRICERCKRLSEYSMDY